MFLSVPHAIEKYVERRYDRTELEAGWHGWRATIEKADIELPSRSEMQVSSSEDDLIYRAPRTIHYVDAKAIGAPAGFHVLRPLERVESLDGAPRTPPLVHRGSSRRPEIALTFDDGPSRWTMEVAAALEKHGCRGTFFSRGTAVNELPDVVAALASRGHELGNHLWSHSRASTQSRVELREEIERTSAAMARAGAPRPALVRPPYFNAPTAVAEAAEGLGVRAVVLRSIGTSDWEAHSAEEIVMPVLAHVQPGDIVCLHDGISSGKREGGESRRPTVAAVAQLVPALLQRGLRPVTVSELLR